MESKGGGGMSKHPHAFNVLDKQIQDGFNRFKQSYSTLGDSVHQAYVQGFLDGIRSNLDELAEVCKLDMKKTNKEE